MSEDPPPEVRSSNSAGKTARAFISSPLGILLLGTVLASVLIPRWSAIWQDRQPELAMKSALADKMAQSTSETVRQAIVLQKKDFGRARYEALKQRWLVSRAELLALTATYFPDSVAECWYSFSDKITDYLLIQDPKSAPQHAPALKTYLQDDNERTTCKPLEDVPSYELERFNERKGTVATHKLLPGYEGLGELLLIERDRIARTITESNAKGFAHGWWIFH